MSTKKPLVSIGLPVFNGEKHIRRVLDSLLVQEYKEFELIISDNASTDETENICKEYAMRDNRIRYIRQTINLGMHGNYNFVLHEAQGEYIMWAASDDIWSPDFIRSLVEVLDENPTAVGAFCPYQFIEEETGSIIEGIRRFPYEHSLPFFRLLRFSWYYDDACIYGLMRKKHLKKMKFQPWTWINADTPYNMAYPVIYFLLSRGNFLMVGERPLWFNSVRINNWHSTPFKANPFLAYLSHIARKINLMVRSVRYIHLGSGSISLVLLIFPFLFLRLLVDCMTPTYAALRIWLSGKKISQVSPHEIWQLGVR